MKSAVINHWGQIDLIDMPMPKLKENEALVRILYCGICGSDIHVYRGKHPTAMPPVPLGHEMIGVVEKINGSFTGEISVGNRVVIHTESCGKCDLCLTGAANQCRKQGLEPRLAAGDSEFMSAHVKDLVRVPDCLSDEVGALLEPFACAVRTNERARIRVGDSVLVIGGGTIGFAVALAAREMGAGRVIMSLKHAERIALAKHYGFEIIDAEREDVVESVLRMTGGEGANATIEASGSAEGVRVSTFATAVEGSIVMLAVGMDPWPAFDVGAIALKELNIVGSRAHTTADMRRAAKLMETLNAKYPLIKMISDIIPLERIEDGFKMMLERRNSGKILVRVNRG